MPAGLVFDQGRLNPVREKYGDIIYTKEFEQLRSAWALPYRFCRVYDLKSKGRVEAVVKYFKKRPVP